MERPENLSDRRGPPPRQPYRKAHLRSTRWRIIELDAAGMPVHGYGGRVPTFPTDPADGQTG